VFSAAPDEIAALRSVLEKHEDASYDALSILPRGRDAHTACPRAALTYVYGTVWSAAGPLQPYAVVLPRRARHVLY
jgi:hypothetical protein